MKPIKLSFPQRLFNSFELRCVSQQTNTKSENRASRTSLFDGLDGLEEGRLRASSSYSHDTTERDNDEALESLQDRVSFLKRLGIISYQVTGDIHEEVESHNRMLDKVGNKMDSARGIMSGTINRFKLTIKLHQRVNLDARRK
ncbi:hypothetical protein Bca101_091610 [Brassica carinata]